MNEKRKGMADGSDEAAAGIRLTGDLRSADPSRIDRALRELDARRRQQREVPIELPGLDELLAMDALGDEQLGLLVGLIRDYSSFDPPLSWLDTIQLATEAFVRSGGRGSAEDVAMGLKVDVDPVGAVREAMRYLWVRGLNDQAERAAAGRLIGALLDGVEVRDTVVQALRAWVDYPELAGVVQVVRPQLTEAESTVLDEAE